MCSPPIPDLASLEERILAAIRERILEVPAGFNAGSDLYAAGLDSMGPAKAVLVCRGHGG